MKKICAGVIAVALLCLSAGYYSRTFLEVVSVFSNHSKQSNFLEVLNDLKTARNQEQMGAKKTCVVIDPGHGGNDPGGIGTSGVLEKDVNLSVALYLKDYLEHQGIEVVMTRETDQGLYSETAANKKKEDLEKRIEIIEVTNPDFVVCIHQNIFTDPKYSGAQVFYYKESETGARLADAIQKQLIAGVDPENTRVSKSNMNYYMLKESSAPIVIVECGFLSNVEEEQKLGTKEYQRDLAWNIYLGAMHFIKDGQQM